MLHLPKLNCNGLQFEVFLQMTVIWSGVFPYDRTAFTGEIYGKLIGLSNRFVRRAQRLFPNHRGARKEAGFHPIPALEKSAKLQRCPDGRSLATGNPGTF
jgi:hypothetical protein